MSTRLRGGRPWANTVDPVRTPLWVRAETTSTVKSEETSKLYLGKADASGDGKNRDQDVAWRYVPHCPRARENSPSEIAPWGLFDTYGLVGPRASGGIRTCGTRFGSSVAVWGDLTERALMAVRHCGRSCRCLPSFSGVGVN
jgi:hypothetical protein